MCSPSAPGHRSPLRRRGRGQTPQGTRHAREAETRTLELLERSLGSSVGREPGSAIRQKLLESASNDIDELLPQLEPRGKELAATAIQRLRERGEREQRDLRETLERQRGRVVEELDRHEGDLDQLALGFDEDERRQLETNMRSWRTRLEQFDRDLEQEPGRVRQLYEVRAQRVEPVGLVYLWPETG